MILIVIWGRLLILSFLLLLLRTENMLFFAVVLCLVCFSLQFLGGDGGRVRTRVSYCSHELTLNLNG